MGFDSYGPSRTPKPPQPVTDTRVIGDIDARQRQDDRSVDVRQVTVRASGANSYADALNLDAGDVESITFYPPGGSAYQVTVNARSVGGGVPSDGIMELAVSGVSTSARAPMTAPASSGSFGCCDADVASTASPLTVLLGWQASGTPSPVSFKIQFISVPL